MIQHMLPCSNILTLYKSLEKTSFVSSLSVGYGRYDNDIFEITVENLKTNQVSTSFLQDLEYYVKEFFLSEDGRHLYVVSDYKLSRLELESLKIEKYYAEIEEFTSIKEIDQKIYVLGDNFVIIIAFDGTKTKIDLNALNPSDVVVLNDALYVTHQENITCISNNSVAFTENTNQDDIIQIFTIKSDELLSISETSAKVWITSDFKETRVYEFQSPVKKTCLNKEKNLLFAIVSDQTDDTDSIEGYFIPDFIKFTTIKTSFTLNSIFLTDNEKFIMLEGNNTYRLVNPAGGSFNIAASVIDSEKIKKCVNGTIDKYDPALDNWFIFPYGLNALHCYAYYNKFSLLRSSLENKTAFISSVIGDPLSIVLDKNYRECANIILSCLRTRVVNDFYALKCLEDKIPELNRKSFKGLDELYDSCFVLNTNTNLPGFCAESAVLPKQRLSSIIGMSGFLEGSDLSGKSVRIEYYTTTIGLSFNVGSKESIDFLRSLKECENSDIFKTRFIKEVLNMKWNIVYKYVLLQSFLYVAYLVSLFVFIVFNIDYCILICFLLNCLLWIYEVIQMISDISEYYSDIWNYIDITRATSLVIYTIFYFAGNSVNEVLFALTVLSMIRGITLFRLSSSTRYMVSLLSESIKSLTSFSVVLVYAVFSYALIAVTIDFPNNEEPFYKQISLVYRLQLGDFDADGVSGILG